MLTWIFAQSDALCNVLIPSLVNFTPAQQRHALNFIKALLVCPRQARPSRLWRVYSACRMRTNSPSRTSFRPVPNREPECAKL